MAWERFTRWLSLVKEPPKPEVTALSLSGGGSRASFEIGALRYLYERVGITAQVIVGTSAGAILSSFIAQSGDHEGQRQAVRQLERMWLDLRGPADMFTENLWFTRLRERTAEWRRLFPGNPDHGTPAPPPTPDPVAGPSEATAQGRNPLSRVLSLLPSRAETPGDSPLDSSLPLDSSSPPDPGTPASPLSPAANLTDAAEIEAATAGAVTATPAVQPVAMAASALPEARRDVPTTLLDETPLASAQEAFDEAFAAVLDPEAQPADPTTWSPGVLLQLLGALPVIGRTGGDLQRILSGLERTRSMFRPGPVLRYLLDPEHFVAKRVEESGVQLRISFVGLESGQLRYLTEDGTIVDRDNVPLPNTPKQRIEVGVLASCAIPGVFPPVHVGAEYCVDGGLRETLPVEMAVSHFGATRTYAIVAAPGFVPPSASFRRRDLLSVMMRSTVVMSDEELRDEVAYARRVGAVVIQPEIDLHDALTVDPGLIVLNRDYGWLRAAEAVLGLEGEDVRLHHDLIAARQAAWALETDLIARSVLPVEEAAPLDPANLDDAQRADLDRLAGIKSEVRELALRIRDEVRPEGAADWWRNWERHPQPILLPPTWLE